MPKNDSESLIRMAKIVQTVDDSRAAGERFKLPLFLRNELDERLVVMESVLPTTNREEGKRRGASSSLTAAFKELRLLLREGYQLVKAAPRYKASESQKLATLTAYGWSQGKLGSLIENTRVLSLARLASEESPKVTVDALRYPKELLAEIQAQVAIIESQEADAETGGRQSAIRARNDARKLLGKSLRCVRYYYCCASDEADATPELARIGFQPTHRSGQRKTASEEAVPPPDKPLPPVVVDP
jgi:hypothetical protein